MRKVVGIYVVLLCVFIEVGHTHEFSQTLRMGMATDSWGFGSRAYTNRLQESLSSYPTKENVAFEVVEILAESGAPSASLNEMLSILAPEIDAYFVQIGGNDVRGFSLDHSDEDLSDVLTQLKDTLQKEINEATNLEKYFFLAKFATPIRIRELYHKHGKKTWPDMFDQVYVDLCKENQSNPFFYCMKRFMNGLESRMYGFASHPNELGHEQIVSNVMEDLKIFYSKWKQN